MILQPFPEPAGPIKLAINQLEVFDHGSQDEKAAKIPNITSVAELPRPWEPASCPNELREHLWSWCDEVAAWINHEYAWRPVHMIPTCWPQHPHIARELAVLACMRYYAEEAATPIAIEEWHRHALPLFQSRLAERLPDGGCLTAQHQSWPAEGRHTAYLATPASSARRDAVIADTRPPRQLRSATATSR